MKHILLTTIAAVVLVGCGESQQMTPAEEAKPVDPVAEVPAKPPSSVESQSTETVTEAANPEPPSGKAPDISIHKAAGDGNIEAVKQHLTAGTDVDARDAEDKTPLHYAAWRGHKEIIELLIDKGASVNAKPEFGTTPLYYAALKGHKETAELLINKGADVNAKRNDGKTPLDFTISYKRPETAELLRKHGGKTGEELKAAEN